MGSADQELIASEMVGKCMPGTSLLGNQQGAQILHGYVTKEKNMINLDGGRVEKLL